MKTKKLIILLSIVISYFGLQAQTIDSTEKKRPFQFTFIYPIGTNGLEATKYESNVSINWIAGYNKSVNGIEFGGFANTLTENLTGIQAAGFSNVVLGTTTGIQASGYSNYARKSFKGCQFSGFSNVVTDSALITQGSGFSNVVKGNTVGTQLSGFSNVIIGTTKGAQVAGFSNVATKEFTGAQISGFSNLTTSKVNGGQVSGFLNVATDSSNVIQAAGMTNFTLGSLIGTQLSGFLNITTKSVTGSQITGFANCAQDLHGVQIAGFLNIAKKLHGTQIGFINYCDTVEKGLPIGFLSIVKHGYKAIEISTSETMLLQASLKLGVPKFYNILSVGTTPKSEDIVTSVGYGIGTKIPLKEKLGITTEFVSNQIFVSTWNMYDYTALHTLKLQASYEIKPKIQAFGGISYNAFVTNHTDESNNYTDSDIVPWSTNTLNYTICLVKTYPGVNAGLRYEF